VLHQEWNISERIVTTTKDREQSRDEALISSISWRKFPTAFASSPPTSRHPVICLAGNSVQSLTKGSTSVPVEDIPDSWNMETANTQLKFLTKHLEESEVEQDLGIHIVAMQLSLAAGVFAFLGGFAGMEREGGNFPFFYNKQFIAIFSFQSEPQLVWGWAVPATIATGNSRLDCLAISPSKERKHLAFSTIESDTGGLFFVEYESKDATPVRVSGKSNMSDEKYD
jgi:hypothetical protein